MWVMVTWESGLEIPLTTGDVDRIAYHDPNYKVRKRLERYIIAFDAGFSIIAPLGTSKQTLRELSINA